MLDNWGNQVKTTAPTMFLIVQQISIATGQKNINPGEQRFTYKGRLDVSRTCRILKGYAQNVAPKVMLSKMLPSRTCNRGCYQIGYTGLNLLLPFRSCYLDKIPFMSLLPSTQITLGNRPLIRGPHESFEQELDPRLIHTSITLPIKETKLFISLEQELHMAINVRISHARLL